MIGSLKSGGLADTDFAKRLISIPPDGEITVCGNYRDETAAAIKTWSDALGRTHRLKINTQCTKTGALVRTYTSAEAEDSCNESKNPFGFAGVRKYADGRTERYIGICNMIAKGYKKMEVVKSTLLHETGHLWGLCDQYFKYGSESDNCEEHYRLERAPTSIMGNQNFSLKLTFYDRMGIRRLGLREDIPVNRQWRRPYQPVTPKDGDLISYLACEGLSHGQECLGDRVLIPGTSECMRMRGKCLANVGVMKEPYCYYVPPKGSTSANVKTSCETKVASKSKNISKESLGSMKKFAEYYGDMPHPSGWFIMMLETTKDGKRSVKPALDPGSEHAAVISACKSDGLRFGGRYHPIRYYERGYDFYSSEATKYLERRYGINTKDDKFCIWFDDSTGDWDKDKAEWQVPPQNLKPVLGKSSSYLIDITKDKRSCYSLCTWD